MFVIKVSVDTKRIRNWLIIIFELAEYNKIKRTLDICVLNNVYNNKSGTDFRAQCSWYERKGYNCWQWRKSHLTKSIVLSLETKWQPPRAGTVYRASNLISPQSRKIVTLLRSICTHRTTLYCTRCITKKYKKYLFFFLDLKK